MVKRFVLYVFAVLLLGFSIVLNTKAGLGVGSINTFPYAVSQITSLTLGTVTTLLYFVFVAAELIIYRKVDVKVLLQIPFSYMMGYIIDFYDVHLNFEVTSFPVGILVLAIAIVCTALAAYIIVTLDLVPNPADGIVRALGFAFHKEFGRMKLMFDCTMIVVTSAVSLIFAHRIIGIGLGTVLSALFIGRTIQVFSRLLNPYLTRVLEESRAHSYQRVRP